MPSRFNEALSIAAVCFILCYLAYFEPFFFFYNDCDLWPLCALPVSYNEVSCVLLNSNMYACVPLSVCVCNGLVGVILGDGQAPIGRDLKRQAPFFFKPSPPLNKD